MELTGTRIGPYELIARIGSSHTSEIHLARAEGMPYAVKLLKPNQAKREFFELIERERAVATAFVHPSTVEIIDITTYEERPAIAMELVWGQPWSMLTRRAAMDRRPLEKSLVQWIGLQIAKLIYVAHKTPWTANDSTGLLHGRIAPSDVLITYDGQIKVPGFGIGRSSLTLPLSPSKAVYKAPELFAGKQDPRADIYALGLSLHDAYTGHVMFKRQTAEETTHAIIANQISQLTQVPEMLARMIGRMTQSSPDLRPQTSEVIDALKDGIPEQAVCQSALSELMVATFPAELKAHRRMRETAFAGLEGDPSLGRAELTQDILPPKLELSALVEIASIAPDRGRDENSWIADMGGANEAPIQEAFVPSAFALSLPPVAGDLVDDLDLSLPDDPPADPLAEYLSSWSDEPPAEEPQRLDPSFLEPPVGDLDASPAPALDPAFLQPIAEPAATSPLAQPPPVTLGETPVFAQAPTQQKQPPERVQLSDLADDIVAL